MVRGRPFNRGGGFAGRQSFHGSSPRGGGRWRAENDKPERRMGDRPERRIDDRPERRMDDRRRKEDRSRSPKPSSFFSNQSSITPYENKPLVKNHRSTREHFEPPSRKKMRSSSPPVRRRTSPLRLRRTPSPPHFKNDSHPTYSDQDSRIYVEERRHQSRSDRYSGAGPSHSSHHERSPGRSNRPSLSGDKHRFDERELKSITIDIKRKVAHERESIIRRIFNPEDLVIARRPGEGGRPLFDREDVMCNRLDIAEDDLRRNVDLTRYVIKAPADSGHQREICPPSKRRVEGSMEGGGKRGKIERPREKGERSERGERRDSRENNDWRWLPNKDTAHSGQLDLRDRIRDRKDSLDERDYRSRVSVKDRLGGRKDDLYRDSSPEVYRERKVASQVSQVSSMHLGMPHGPPLSPTMSSWSFDPQSVPKNSNYFEHDDREDMRGRFRGRFRGRMRGRSSFRGSRPIRRGRGFGYGE